MTSSHKNLISGFSGLRREHSLNSNPALIYTDVGHPPMFHSMGFDTSITRGGRGSFVRILDCVIAPEKTGS